jgi:selenocysteine lyase/cysteine desulfurase
MTTSQYHKFKTRYLNRARIAFSDKELMHEFAESFQHLNIYDPNMFPLRKTISKLFHLSETLSFRQNATQMFRDILEGIVYHNNFNENSKSYQLFLSDIDHPVMIDMAKIVLSDQKVKTHPFAYLFINNISISQNEISDIFVDAAINSNSNIILIPHVNWVNGAKLDIVKICRKIKKFNNEIITIVDGAQALGNIDVKLDHCGCESSVDFYISCGQKWMGCPIPIGFARVSENFKKGRNDFSSFIFTCDYFSEFAGNEGYLNKPAMDTYNIHLSLLFDIVVKKFQNNKGLTSSYHFHDILSNLKPLIEILEQSKLLKLLKLPTEMQSGIISVTGIESTLERFSNNLNEKQFSHTFDSLILENEKISFVRLSSPFESFENKSGILNDFASAVNKLK